MHSDYDWLILSHFRIGQVFWINEDFDASGDAGLTPDEAISFERDDHLVDRRWADAGSVAACRSRRAGAGACASMCR